MRCFMSTWLSGSVVLALCVSAFLGGCAIASDVPDEHLAAAQGALDDRHDTSGDRGEALGEREGDDPEGDDEISEPEPLPWHDHLLAAELSSPSDDPCLAELLSSPEPEPLPWHLAGGNQDVKGDSTPERDKRR
jgi:hypothetical protein